MSLIASQPTNLTFDSNATGTTLETGWRSSRSSLQVRHLEDVRDNLRRLKQRQQPQDFMRNASHFIVQWNGTTPEGFFIHQDGVRSAPMKLDRHALRQMAAFLLPARGLGFIDSLTKKSTIGGDKVASMAWDLHRQAYNNGEGKDHTFRTILGTDNLPMVRAVLSGGYPRYDNLDLIEDAMVGLRERIDEWAVVDYSVRNSKMRVRLLHQNEVHRAMAVNKPIPGISLRDSEVGTSRVYILPETFTPWCSNGCGHWAPLLKQGYSRPHSGVTSDQIRGEVADKMESTLTEAYGIRKAYNQAMHVKIDDAFAWFQAQVGTDITQYQQEQVETAMASEPTVRGTNLLGTVVDAVTWVAHEQMDLDTQHRMERLGGQLLHAGLEQQVDRRILIDA